MRGAAAVVYVQRDEHWHQRTVALASLVVAPGVTLTCTDCVLEHTGPHAACFVSVQGQCVLERCTVASQTARVVVRVCGSLEWRGGSVRGPGTLIHVAGGAAALVQVEGSDARVALLASGGATAAARQCQWSGLLAVCVALGDSTLLSVAECALGGGLYGVSCAVGAARASVEGGSVAHCVGVGAVALGSRAQLALANCVVGHCGVGVQLHRAHGDVTRCRVAHARAHGVLVGHKAAAVLCDSRVCDNGHTGVLVMTSGAAVATRMVRCEVARNRVGVWSCWSSVERDGATVIHGNTDADDV